MYDAPFSQDWVGVDNPWVGVNLDLSALHTIVCQVLCVSSTQCGPPVELDPKEEGDACGYARVYSFQLPSQSVIARVVAPVKPHSKTEAEVAAMDFVWGRTTLPVPAIFAYCSDASNPVGAEWLIMQHVPGVSMRYAWDDMTLPQKQCLALDIIDIYDQLYRLKADGCGAIYHNVNSVDDSHLMGTKNLGLDFSGMMYGNRSPRWTPLSQERLCVLRDLCSHPVTNGYQLGPHNDVPLLYYSLRVPSPTETMPTFTSEEYVRLLAYNGIPATRSDYDFPSREKCIELFRSVQNLYPNSSLFGSSGNTNNFRFTHGDLHAENIIIDPNTGSITGIIDWECAGYVPLWTDMSGVGWFKEDTHRFIFGADPPEKFENDTGPRDAALRAFFRTELHKRNPDLFSCFLGGIELRAILHAASDAPAPVGGTKLFLPEYFYGGWWNEARRGPFPWDMPAWIERWLALDKAESIRVAGLMKIHGLQYGPGSTS